MIFQKIKQKKQKYILIFLLVATVIMIIQLISNPHPFFPTRLPSPLVRYDGIYHPFTILHPKSWPVYETKDGNHGDHEVIGWIVGTAPGVLIAKTNITDSIKVISWGTDRAKRCKNFTLVSEQEFDTSNLIFRMDYTCDKYLAPFSKSLETTPCRDYYKVLDSSAYALTFCARDYQWPEVENVFSAMAESFDLIR